MTKILMLVTVSTLLGCGYRKVPPDRPRGVPVLAGWAGGPDGGSFILCAVDAEKDVNNCTVYNEDTGQIMDRGAFKLGNENRAARAEELKYAWADWGGMIGLTDQRVLKRIQSPVP
jgi:hypothetical protein